VTGNAACLENRKPARRQHRIVGRPQQHAIAGYEAHVVDENAGNAIGVFEELGIGPCCVDRSQTRARPLPLRHGAVEQFDCGVHSLGIAEVRQRLLIDNGPQLDRRETSAGKIIDEGARIECDGSHIKNSWASPSDSWRELWPPSWCPPRRRSTAWHPARHTQQPTHTRPKPGFGRQWRVVRWKVYS